MLGWNEAQHPRDDIGRFTYKNGGESSDKQRKSSSLYDNLNDGIKKRMGDIQEYKEVEKEGASSYDIEREKLQNRADILFPNTVEKKTNIDSSETIAGVSRGEPMSYEQAGGKNVNPKFSMNGNPTYRKNCQSCVAVFEARMQGYNIEIELPKTAKNVEIMDELELRPNLAYIDPETNSIPEFTTLKVKNKNDCIKELETAIKPNARYIFAFPNKKMNSYDNNPFSHVVIVMKDKNNNLKFYDPQSGSEKDTNYLDNVKFYFELGQDRQFPKILRVDDKKLNYKILNSISKAKKVGTN